MASEKVKAAIRKQHLFEFRSQCHVYKIDDDVLSVVRNFIANYMRIHKNDMDRDDLMDMSWFISQTDYPYRSKKKNVFTKNHLSLT